MNQTYLSDIIVFGRNTLTPIKNNPIKNNLKYYNTIAKEYLNKYINKKYYDIKNIISNDDLMCDLTSALIMADITFDPNKAAKTTWRIKCMVWQLQNAFNKNKRNNKTLNNGQINSIEYKIRPEEELERKEMNKKIHKIISSLTKKHGEIITDYYFNNLTQDKISKKHEISQPRVSQIIEHNEYIFRKILRNYI